MKRGPHQENAAQQIEISESLIRALLSKNSTETSLITSTGPTREGDFFSKLIIFHKFFFQNGSISKDLRRKKLILRMVRFILTLLKAG